MLASAFQSLVISASLVAIDGNSVGCKLGYVAGSIYAGNLAYVVRRVTTDDAQSIVFDVEETIKGSRTEQFRFLIREIGDGPTEELPPHFDVSEIVSGVNPEKLKSPPTSIRLPPKVIHVTGAESGRQGSASTTDFNSEKHYLLVSSTGRTKPQLADFDAYELSELKNAQPRWREWELCPWGVPIDQIEVDWSVWERK